MGIGDIFKISDIKNENEKLKKEIEELKSYFNQFQGMDPIQLNNAINKLKTDIQNLELNKQKSQNEINQVEQELNKLRMQIVSSDEEITLESFALYKPHFAFHNSHEYKLKLDEIREKQKEMIKTDRAASCPTEWTVNNSKSEGKKFVKSLKKLLLRSFNNECDYCVDHVKFSNIDQSEKRMSTSFDTINKLGEITQISLSHEYKKLKFDELHLAYEYQLKKQEEKEEQARLREEIREQQKLEKEIKLAREKIAKEKKHYAQVIAEITQRISDSTDEQELIDLNSKLEKLQKERLALDEEEKLVDYREKNAKAGYIYIISNIGAFGKNVFKIGMTRRLDPYERVYELGDSSVPFPFDTHAMIFSDNAPALEAIIHQHFHKNRLNKINNRREFFVADVNELEKVIRENYDKVIDFVKESPAEQYRESLLTRD
ncbi:MAG: DUF4041 domain-containing protein [Methanomicrobiales archaeon HGW-Methanomicrobiales-2]|jgi:hypothetical protein|nr:MAG: DUF4041 domain-containing protein [Methanomicrobiales archaeon HGW-Methanomicrobiales-2]